MKPDPDKFPEWTPELREAMKTETPMFFEHVLRENRPVCDFLDANYTFLNERLAEHYGIEGVAGSEFRRVDAVDRSPRRGAEPGRVLTVSSYPTRTSPVIRGKYVLQNILGTPPPPPPADVPLLEERPGPSRSRCASSWKCTARIRICASCHRNMDPLGFGLENYDAIGRWRDTDGEFPVDASGTLPSGQRFSDGRGDARAPVLAIAAVLTNADRENADLCSAARPGAVRPAHGRRHPSRRWRPTGTVPDAGPSRS